MEITMFGIAKRTDGGLVIAIWHPLLRKKITGGLFTNDPVKLANISNHLKQLVHEPHWHDLKMEPEAQRKFEYAAVKCFYRPYREATQVRGIETYRRLPTKPNELWTDEELARDNVRKDKEIEYLRRQLAMYERQARMGKPIGAHSTLTVQEAYDAWKGELHGLTERRKAEVLRCAFVILKEYAGISVLNLRTKDLMATVAATLVGPMQKANYIKTTKRCLRWVSKHFDLDLDLDGLKAPSTSTIYLRMGDKPTLDEAALLAFLRDEKQDLYWRALIGTLACAGLRLSELATLEWADVELDQRIIHVKHKPIHLLKRETHERSTKALHPEIFWPLLERLKVKSQNALVFPHPEDGKSWYRGSRACILLTKALSQGGGRHPFQHGAVAERARRYCQNAMEHVYGGELTNLMLGHTASIARSNYTNILSRVRKLP